ncbi:MAG: M42 family metallopeptidase [Betaproteobacteria bacterium]
MDHQFDVEYVAEALLRLLAIPSVAGKTDSAIAFVAGELQASGLATRRTAKGSLVATLPGRASGGGRTLSAHLDTLGAMVKQIKENGRLKLTPVGVYLFQAIEGEYCTVETTDGRTFTGTVLTTEPSVHVYDEPAKLERKQENMEIRLDERVQTKAEVEALGIRVGDYISFDPRAVRTPSGFIKARHLDDKAGVATLLGVARQLARQQITPTVTTHLFFSVWEEVGHGASAGIPAETREFVAVDMGAVGTGQTSDEYSVSVCAKDSNGPYHYGLRTHLARLAEENGIPYRVDVYPHYGSDAGAALRSGLDAVTALIGPGVDASHAYERTHLSALEATGRLLVAYLQSPLVG